VASGGAFFDERKNWSRFWKESLTESKDHALRARFAADDARWRAFGMGFRHTPPLRSGVVVDCGSGHTSVMFYATGGEAGSAVRQVQRAWLQHADGGNLPLTDILPDASGSAFEGTTLASRLDEFVRSLRDVIEEQRGDGPPWGSLYVGATGGVREKVAQGLLGEPEIAVILDEGRPAILLRGSRLSKPR
jgi:hypothetical protein